MESKDVCQILTREDCIEKHGTPPYKKEKEKRKTKKEKGWKRMCNKIYACIK